MIATGTLPAFAFCRNRQRGCPTLRALAATADLAHLERMRFVERPDRRPVAILMADLEASSPLARRLSTAQYFAFSRRLVRAADRCIIDAGGIVGRHAGDGVVAFFLADTAGSESAAARACITAARTLRDSLAGIATRSEHPRVRAFLAVRAALGRDAVHGPDPHAPVAARSPRLGDEVNEAARIEACATGGRTLASKSLIERLTADDAEAVRTRHCSHDIHAAGRTRHRDRQSPTRRILDRCLRGLNAPELTIGRGRRSMAPIRTRVP